MVGGVGEGFGSVSPMSVCDHCESCSAPSSWPPAWPCGATCLASPAPGRWRHRLRPRRRTGGPGCAACPVWPGPHSGRAGHPGLGRGRVVPPSSPDRARLAAWVSRCEVGRDGCGARLPMHHRGACPMASGVFAHVRPASRLGAHQQGGAHTPAAPRRWVLAGRSSSVRLSLRHTLMQPLAGCSAHS